ncbi:MAG: DinB family protein [Bacteroidetes bacterium]|nr:DinB family protein [Bacteroidota bacterium]
MEKTYTKLIINQLKAALATLAQAIKYCPEFEWHETHKDYPFSQVVFHTLFFTDYYLEGDLISFKEQGFHKENSEFFKDYEELEYKLPENLYERVKSVEYLNFCIDKCELLAASETDDTLKNLSGLLSSKKNKPFTRAELYIYVTRHVQHHAAQLGLRVQLITGKELDWVRG